MNLRIFALGGLGEVGMNLMVLECDQDLILIDCGVLFPDLSWMGLDVVTPNFEYLVQNQARIKGLVITHGHEDHIGSIPHLLRYLKLPIIYCSRFASRLIQEKCDEYGVGDQLLLYPVAAGDRVDVGMFGVEFIHITHSTLESFALAIETPVGLIVHSGDFKFDEKPYQGPPSNKKRLAALGRQRPLLLLSDSTNSEKHGHSASESSITKDLERLVGEAEGAVVVALFASNIHRVHQLIDIAKKNDRVVFLSGRSMSKYVKIAIEENFLPIDLNRLKPLEDLPRTPRDKILVLSTGSQGEARSSLLRLARDENPFLKLQPKDVVILSSRNIPGNERAVNFVVNELFKRGAVVHYEDMHKVHVSGHAYKDEQLEMIKMIKPKYFIPVHGEYRQMAWHAKTAEEAGIPPANTFVMVDGQVWAYDSAAGLARVLDETVPAGRRWVFRGFHGMLDDEVIKERRRAAHSGVISLEVPVNQTQSQLVGSVDVQLRAFLCDVQTEARIAREIADEIQLNYEKYDEQNIDGMTREQYLAVLARRVVRRILNTKPLVITHLRLAP